MDGFLRVDNTTTIFPGSPTNSFLADDTTSVCPLLTPSPPTNDLINPLPETSCENTFAIGEELANKLHEVRGNEEKGLGDSPSSSSSQLAEPVCAQLLNHRNVYHHITKDEDTAAQETIGKSQPLQLTFRNPPEDYFFMSWNWPVIRKVSVWVFLAGLVGMLALVIAMIATLPKTCNPPTQWYQGSVLYEIFPASYDDTNQDMVGDFKGITRRINYIKKLGVRGIRLNSIFESQNYPEDYMNTTTLINISKQLGTVKDFENLVNHLHSQNISLILDLPIWPVVKQLTPKSLRFRDNETNLEPSVEFLKRSPFDLVEEALIYWTNLHVDGFYLKGLEKFVNDTNFGQSLRRWKEIIGPERVFIVSQEVINTTPQSCLSIVLNRVDLVDVRLEIDKGVTTFTKQIEHLQNSTLFKQRGMPWIHWSLGDISTKRLANRLNYGNATLGATLLQLMLPGTPSIFYGDEIGLPQVFDPNDERKDVEHLHHLTFMPWSDKEHEILPWMHGDKTLVHFEQADLISNMTNLRKKSPSIYVNAVFKVKEQQNKANSEIKYSTSDLLVIQRWYPRRKSYVVVSNFGKDRIEADLSTLLYSGNVKVGPRPDSHLETISFKEISLWPGESVIIELN